MGVYTLAQRTTDGTTAAPAWELIAGTRGALVKEIGVALAAATATTLGLGRPAAKGVGPTSPVTFLPYRPSNPQDPTPTAAAAVAWGTTAPTIPAAFLRRFALPATVGSNFVWKFGGHGLWIPAGASLVLWNLASNGVIDVYAEIEQ